MSFTGSTPVGVRLMKDAADNVLRTSMELGGNAPLIVFEDADLDAAVEGAFAAKMRNMGEACTAANRFLVHEDVAEEFTQKFVAKLEALKPLRGTDPESTLGPIVDEGARDDIDQLVQDAVAAGGEVLTGGHKIEGDGYFYAPTAIKVEKGNPILQQEIFGPVAPIVTFSSEEEAIEMANDTEYGLASYVFTKDQARMYRVAESIEFGLMGYNVGVISNPAAPFGGMKQSGLGREGGAEGIEEYTTVQYIGIADPWAATKA